MTSPTPPMSDWCRPVRLAGRNYIQKLFIRKRQVERFFQPAVEAKITCSLLGIFAAGYPASGPITCNADEPGTVIDETINAGGSSLSYDASSGQYNYVWKTNKAWNGTCQILVVRFIDGTDHIAKFSFR